MDAIDKLAAAVGGGAFTVDLLDPDQVDGLIPRVEATIAPVDVLVNNAGLENSNWFHEEEAGRIRDVIRLNLEAPLVLTRECCPACSRVSGHLVFTSSLAATASFPALSVYAGTKAGSHRRARRRSGSSWRHADPHDNRDAGPGRHPNVGDHLEDAPTMTDILKRLRLLQLIPKRSPELIARRTVAAVLANRRHVRTAPAVVPVLAE